MAELRTVALLLLRHPQSLHHRWVTGSSEEIIKYEVRGFNCVCVCLGFVELSPEELRMEYYTSRATGDVQSFVSDVLLHDGFFYLLLILNFFTISILCLQQTVIDVTCLGSHHWLTERIHTATVSHVMFV